MTAVQSGPIQLAVVAVPQQGLGGVVDLGDGLRLLAGPLVLGHVGHGAQLLGLVQGVQIEAVQGIVITAQGVEGSLVVAGQGTGVQGCLPQLQGLAGDLVDADQAALRCSPPGSGHWRHCRWG